MPQFVVLLADQPPQAGAGPRAENESLSSRRWPIMSRLIPATTLSIGTVGCAAQYFEPNSPFSSPSVARISTERLGGSARNENASTNSINARGAAGVVVRAGMDVAGIEAHAVSAVAHVIVMRLDQHVFVFQRRIAAGNHAHDVAKIRRKRLLEFSFRPGGLKFELRVLFDQIFSRFGPARRAGLAAFHFFIGERLVDSQKIVAGDRFQRRFVGCTFPPPLSKCVLEEKSAARAKLSAR